MPLPPLRRKATKAFLEYRPADRTRALRFESPEEQAQARLRAIERAGLMVEGDDSRFVPIVYRAAVELHQPIALMTVILRSTQHFVATYGATGWLSAARGTPIEWAFCRHVIARGCTFLVEDAASHPLVADNPLVRFNGIRTYAGTPVKDRDGLTIGALCVLGRRPHHFTLEEVTRLQELAAQICTLLEQPEASGPSVPKPEAISASTAGSR